MWCSFFIVNWGRDLSQYIKIAFCATHHCRHHQTAGGGGSCGGKQAPQRAPKTDADDGMHAERRQRGAAARCTTAGCNLLAGPMNAAGVTGYGKCCGFCPTSRTWACLSQHTVDERAAALRYQAAHDSASGEQSTSSAKAGPAHEPSAVATVTNVHEIESAVSEAWLASPGDDVSPTPVTKAPSTSMDAESALLRRRCSRPQAEHGTWRQRTSPTALQWTRGG